eukprot:1161904-Pelagomonas_calceolata.AAC.2
MRAACSKERPYHLLKGRAPCLAIFLGSHGDKVLWDCFVGLGAPGGPWTQAGAKTTFFASRQSWTASGQV